MLVETPCAVVTENGKRKKEKGKGKGKSRVSWGHAKLTFLRRYKLETGKMLAYYY